MSNTESKFYHPAEEGSALNISLVAKSNPKFAGALISGRPVLSQMFADVWQPAVKNAIVAQLYVLCSTLRSLTEREITAVRDMAARGLNRLCVFTANSTVYNALLNFQNDPDLEKQHATPEWLIKRILGLVDSLGLTLVPVLVPKDDNKQKRLYSFVARVSEYQTLDPESAHILPTAYTTQDLRLVDPEKFHARRNARLETATKPNPRIPEFEAQMLQSEGAL